LKYLKDHGIGFCVRTPKHHLIALLDAGVQLPAELAKEQALHLPDCS